MKGGPFACARHFVAVTDEMERSAHRLRSSKNSGGASLSFALTVASDLENEEEREDRDGGEPRCVARSRADGLHEVANGVGDLGDDGLEHVGSYLLLAARKHSAHTHDQISADLGDPHPLTCGQLVVSTANRDRVVLFLAC